jgi:hypothetical protein
MVRHPFTTDLLGTAAFAHGVEQLDPVGVVTPSTVVVAKKTCVQY